VSQSAEVPYLLRLAETLPGDPQVDDLGPLYAAVARHQAAAMGQDVYGSDWLKAAALLHTLARLPGLEHSNRAFAWAAAVGLLAINDHTLDYKPADAVTLVKDVSAGLIGVQQIASALRSWQAHR
jgi:prophage maintenance system killer protein